MGKTFRRVVKVLGLGAVAGTVVGFVRSVRRQPEPPTSGEATWDPIAPSRPAPERNGPVEFAESVNDDATPDEASEPS